jgi:hypothetical protein
VSWCFVVFEACTPSTAPAQSPTAASIYSALVEAGCLGADDGGAAAIAQEHALPDQPAWLSCLFAADGGTIASCAVPCK